MSGESDVMIFGVGSGHPRLDGRMHFFNHGGVLTRFDLRHMYGISTKVYPFDTETEEPADPWKPVADSLHFVSRSILIGSDPNNIYGDSDIPAHDAANDTDFQIRCPANFRQDIAVDTIGEYTASNGTTITNDLTVNGSITGNSTTYDDVHADIYTDNIREDSTDAGITVHHDTTVNAILSANELHGPVYTDDIREDSAGTGITMHHDTTINAALTTNEFHTPALYVDEIFENTTDNNIQIQNRTVFNDIVKIQPAGVPDVGLSINDGYVTGLREDTQEHEVTPSIRSYSSSQNAETFLALGYTHEITQNLTIDQEWGSPYDSIDYLHFMAQTSSDDIVDTFTDPSAYVRTQTCSYGTRICFLDTQETTENLQEAMFFCIYSGGADTTAGTAFANEEHFSFAADGTLYTPHLVAYKDGSVTTNGLNEYTTDNGITVHHRMHHDAPKHSNVLPNSTNHVETTESGYHMDYEMGEVIEHIRDTSDASGSRHWYYTPVDASRQGGAWVRKNDGTASQIGVFQGLVTNEHIDGFAFGFNTLSSTVDRTSGTAWESNDMAFGSNYQGDVYIRTGLYLREMRRDIQKSVDGDLLLAMQTDKELKHAHGDGTILQIANNAYEDDSSTWHWKTDESDPANFGASVLELRRPKGTSPALRLNTFHNNDGNTATASDTFDSGPIRSFSVTQEGAVETRNGLHVLGSQQSSDHFTNKSDLILNSIRHELIRDPGNNRDFYITNNAYKDSSNTWRWKNDESDPANRLATLLEVTDEAHDGGHIFSLWTLRNNDTNSATAGDTFDNGPTEQFTIDQDGNALTGGTHQQISDRREKENVNALSPQASHRNIMQTQCCEYVNRRNRQKRRGFIAQNLKENWGYGYGWSSGSERLTVVPTEVLATLVSAYRHMARRVDALEKSASAATAQ